MGWNTLGRTIRIGAVALAASVVLPPVMSAADKAKVLSTWRDREVQVDGAPGTEWTELLPFTKKSPFSLAVTNDEHFLYVALDTGTEANIVQMLRQGLIVWLDGQGKKNKRFGIKFPVGVMGGERGTGGPGREGGPPSGAMPGGFGGGGGRSRASGRMESPSPGPMWERAEAEGQFKQLEILGADKQRRIVSVSTATPIEVGITWVDGVVFYELKVPLAKVDELVGIGATPGAIIGIGLETPGVADDRSRGGMGGMGSGGMGGGMGGGGMGGGQMGGGGFGGPGGGRFGGMTQAVKEWTTVALAAGPAAK